jgi:hypothetical protein
MTELERLKLEIERHARDRDWQMHANAVERLIELIRKESK